MLFKIFNIYLSRKLPRGVDVFYDLRDYPINKILDIGAGTGEFYKKAHRTFPKATVYSYEPVFLSYNKLRYVNPNSYYFAISNHKGIIRVSTDKRDMNRITCHGQQLALRKTIDSLHASADLVKIDVEGHELQVLEGMTEALKKTMFVLIECTFDKDNDYHVHIDKIILPGFKVFGIYEQVGEWTKNEPQLRRADVLYINTKESFNKQLARSAKKRD